MKYDDDQGDVGERQAYEWVKTGKWDLKRFSEWVLQVNRDGYLEGLETARCNDAMLKYR